MNHSNLQEPYRNPSKLLCECVLIKQREGRDVARLGERVVRRVEKRRILNGDPEEDASATLEISGSLPS